MTFFRTLAAMAAVTSVFLVSNARAEGARIEASPVLGPATASPTCTRPVPNRTDAGSTSSFTWSFVDGTGVQVRVAIGKGATAVNNSGGVVAQVRPGTCSGTAHD